MSDIEALNVSEIESLHGLTCPQCGGMVPVPEGQVVVKCPYCELRSFVRGERGLRRYQVPQRINHETSTNVMRKFLRKSWAIARDAAGKSQLQESFLVYIPFWTVWGRVAAWVFGEKKIKSGDKTRYEPREVRVVQEMVWTGAACDVGEFGVNQISLTNQDMEPFEPSLLHAAGMVFEPVGSFTQARETAEKQFEDKTRRKAGLDRLSQFFIRFFRRRYGLVYYPLWVSRYLYRGRSFQVVVDGYSGEVLYGKAPGNTLYRAAVLVGGMALGAFLAVDVSTLLLYLSSGADEDNLAGVAVVVFLVGLGIIAAAYRAFRYGEHYEYRKPGSGSGSGAFEALKDGLGVLKTKEVEEWINLLN